MEVQIYQNDIVIKKTERGRERESDKITSVFIFVWIKLKGNVKPTIISPLNELFKSFQVLPWKLNVYQCIELLVFLRRRIANDNNVNNLKSWFEYVTIW